MCQIIWFLCLITSSMLTGQCFPEKIKLYESETMSNKKYPSSKIKF